MITYNSLHKFDFGDQYLVTDSITGKNLQITDLIENETIIKENILDGEYIDWIKVNKRNNSIIIGSYKL